MPKVTVPNEKAQRIIRENHMDPDDYGVTYQDKDTIRLLCFDTRDDIVIHRGDRPW